ncbi:MAG: hypothetical protein AAGB00_02385 [Planctomycetota bacterium]
MNDYYSAKAPLALCLFACLTPGWRANSSDAALITWEGDVPPGVAAFGEANWTGPGESPGPSTNPPSNGMIDPNSPIMFDMLVETGFSNQNGYESVPAQVGPVNGIFFIGGGFELTIGGEARFLMNTSPTGQGGFAIRGPSASNRAIVSIRDDAFLRVENFLLAEVNVSDNAFVEIDSPTGVFNNSPLSIAAGWSGAIEFLALTPSAVAGLSFLNVATVDGAPAQIGANIALLSNNNGGTLLIRIPEPSTCLLAGMSSLLLLGRRPGARHDS